MNRKFNQHKNVIKNKTDANGNKVLFKLSYDEWLSIWQESGHMSEMGVGKGKYCMARKNDVGHYEAGNVFIQDHAQNLFDGWEYGSYSPFNPKSEEHKRKISEGMKRYCETKRNKK